MYVKKTAKQLVFSSKSVKKSLASLSSLALCFQPRSRPFVWLLTRTWIRKNTDCFAIYMLRGNSPCNQRNFHLIRYTVKVLCRSLECGNMNSAIKEFNNVAFHNNNLLEYFCKKKKTKIMLIVSKITCSVF